MTMEKEDLKRFSTDLAQVMEDIGVNEVIVPLRRHVSFVVDRAKNISVDQFYFVTFGSQSEGSTTIDMHSDHDTLNYSDHEVACVHFADFQDSKRNYYVIKESMSLPQCCCLQVDRNVVFKEHIRRNSISSTESLENQFIVDQEDRVLLNSRFYLNFFFNIKHFATRRQHGPALTCHNRDVVFAIRCMTLPYNCRVLFTRPRPGHWPTKETLSKAEQCEVYMVNPGVQGHTFGYDNERRLSFIKIKYQNEYVDSQFRMSTNMIERLLMFDLNIVQMKAYVLTKMIRNEFLQPLVDDRLSTFHMKTALFFTVERCPEDIWRDDNLVQCVIYCLTTLKRFLKKFYFPHYTIGSVNLFAEKLKVNEFHSVRDKITEMIDSGLSCLRTLDMDHVGMRLSTSVADLNHYNILPGAEIHVHIITKLIEKLDFSRSFQRSDELGKKKFIALAFHSVLKTEHKYRAELEYIFKSLKSTIASQQASECIANGSDVTSDIINRYETSLGSNSVSNHLRYASMLVCTDQLEHAFGVLSQITTLIKHDALKVLNYLKHCIYLNLTSDVGHNRWTQSETLMSFAEMCAVPIVFTRLEINCIPSHLICEMFGTNTKDERKNAPFSLSGRCGFHVFKSGVRPFFYYLQYLSSSNAENKQLALARLSDYCEIELKYQTSDNIATELNMLGHVHELENNFADAWRIYRKSVTLKPRCNASYWHLFRLFGQVVNGKV